MGGGVAGREGFSHLDGRWPMGCKKAFLRQGPPRRRGVSNASPVFHCVFGPTRHDSRLMWLVGWWVFQHAFPFFAPGSSPVRPAGSSFPLHEHGCVGGESWLSCYNLKLAQFPIKYVRCAVGFINDFGEVFQNIFWTKIKWMGRGFEGR